MAEQIRELIEKIQKEGVEAGLTRSREIEEAAKAKAQEIISQAQSQAKKILEDARQEAARMDEKGKALLSQAGRDTMLLLRKEILSMLERLVAQEAARTFSAEAMAQVLAEMLSKASLSSSQEVVISARPEDVAVLQQGFLAKLKEACKAGVTLRPSQDISAGFTVSFDGGKSCFDFSDRALAEYIGTYLKPQLNGILKG